MPQAASKSLSLQDVRAFSRRFVPGCVGTRIDGFWVLVVFLIYLLYIYNIYREYIIDLSPKGDKQTP